MPPHLQLTLLNVPSTAESTTSLPRPQHVILNHIYVQRGQVGGGAAHATWCWCHSAGVQRRACLQRSNCCSWCWWGPQAQLGDILTRPAAGPAATNREWDPQTVRVLRTPTTVCCARVLLPCAGCERNGRGHHPQVQGQVHHISAVQAARPQQQQQQLQCGGSRGGRQCQAHVNAPAAALLAAAAPAPLTRRLGPAEPLQFAFLGVRKPHSGW